MMELPLLALLFLGYTYAAITNEHEENIKNVEENDDLKIDASTYYSDRYSEWSRNYPNGYSYTDTGYGSLDDRYYNSAAGYNTYGSYDGGYTRGRNYGSYGNPDGWYRNGYDSVLKYRPTGNPGPSDYGYGGNTGYGYGGNNGYAGSNSYGYGGYGGNGGLSSYYGYNNPSYPGGYHLGYGYYNKGPGYGNIYNNGVTPSLVTGYRGYSKK